VLAAEAAEAAGAQGKFWELHDRLFAHQDQLDAVSLIAHAGAIGLDLERFTRDLGSSTYAARVRADVASAHASGAEGTPTFFVNGRRHVGRYDEETLAAALRPPAAAEPIDEAGRPQAVSSLLPAVGRMRDISVEPAPLVLDGLEEEPDAEGIWPRLAPDQIALLARFGERRALAAGETFEPGADFVVVLSGAVALVDGYGQENRVRGVHGRGRFLGGLGVLTGEARLLTPVAQRPTEVLTVPGEALRAAFDANRELHDLVLRALLLRRAYVLGMAEVRIVGSGSSAAARRLRELLTAGGVLYSWLDLDSDQLAADVLRDLGVGADETPVVITRDRQILRNPSEDELSRALDLADRRA
jgi:CRP-like cAMP-binding protein